MKKLLIYLTTALISYGCSKQDPIPVSSDANGVAPPGNALFGNTSQTLYTINEGQHESNRTPDVIFAQSLSYNVTFYSNCKYLNVNPLNQGDINKLFGFTEGLVDVHQNSARFGWNYDPATDLINIFSYCYVNGIVTSQKIAEVPVETPVNCRLLRERDFYRFYVDNTLVNSVAKNPGNPSVSVKNFPYFGGDETAPHLMQIQLK